MKKVGNRGGIIQYKWIIKNEKELTNFYRFQIREQKQKKLYDLRKKFDEDRELEDMAKYVYDRTVQMAGKYMEPGDAWAMEKQLRRSFLSIMAKNPDLAIKLEGKFSAISNRILNESGDSLQIRLYERGLKSMNEDRDKLKNFFNSSTDETIREIPKRINEMTGVEGY